jgi:hypothetical protein
MKLIVFAAAGLMFFALFVLWLQSNLQYRIGRQHMKILCFRIALRKIDLTDIKHISKRKPSGLAEYWYNTIHPKHRTLTIQRYRGLRKNVVITPRNRYVFMSDLQSAIRRVKPETDVEALVDQSPEPAGESSAEPSVSETTAG